MTVSLEARTAAQTALDQRRADEKRAKEMAQASAARRVVCPRCGDRNTYTFRRCGELLFACYAYQHPFDETGPR